MRLLGEALGVLGLRLVELENGALARLVTPPGIVERLLAGEHRLAGRLVFLLRGRSVAIRLLDFLVQALLRVLHLQFLIEDVDTSRTNVVAHLEAVEERDAQREAHDFLPVLPQLLAERARVDKLPSGGRVVITVAVARPEIQLRVIIRPRDAKHLALALQQISLLLDLRLEGDGVVVDMIGRQDAAHVLRHDVLDERLLDVERLAPLQLQALRQVEQREVDIVGVLRERHLVVRQLRLDIV